MYRTIPTAVLAWLFVASMSLAQPSRYERYDQLPTPPVQPLELEALAQPEVESNRQPIRTSNPLTSNPSNRERQPATNGSSSISSTVLPSRPLGESTYGPAQEPAESSSSPSVRSQFAEQMMQAMLTPGPNSQLTGRPTQLAEVLAAASSRAAQSQRANAYWDLCSAVADYYLALHEQAELERLAARTPQMSQALRAAVARLKTRRSTALIAAQATQLRLAALLGRGSSSLPLPQDPPLCASYQTRLAKIFPAGAPREVTELDQLLPLRHAELLAAAQGVTEAEQWFDDVVSRAGTAQAAEGVVRALELLALSRRAFVQLARDYNRRITRYTELARPGQVSTQRLVAMMIKADSSSSTTASRASETRPSLPSTFQGDWRSPTGNTSTNGNTSSGRYNSTPPSRYSAEKVQGRLIEKQLKNE